MPLRCPVVVGRREELAALSPVTEAAGVAALVVGEAGVGKWALVRAAATELGHPVFAGRAVLGRPTTRTPWSRGSRSTPAPTTGSSCPPRPCWPSCTGARTPTP